MDQLEKDAKVVAMMQRSNVDRYNFYERQTLGNRLRAKYPNRLPVLLYWHNQIDRAGSVFGLPSNLKDKKSFFEIAKETIMGSSELTQSIAATQKLLVPKDVTLRYLVLHARQKLVRGAKSFLKCQFNTDFEAVWNERQRKLVQAYPEWAETHGDIVPVFYNSRTKTPTELPCDVSMTEIDDKMRGDDHIIRLFVSFEFRKLHEDRIAAKHKDSALQKTVPSAEQSSIVAKSSVASTPIPNSLLSQATKSVAYASGSLVRSGTHIVNGVVGGTVGTVRLAGNVGSSAVSTVSNVGYVASSGVANVGSLVLKKSGIKKREN